VSSIFSGTITAITMDAGASYNNRFGGFAIAEGWADPNDADDWTRFAFKSEKQAKKFAKTFKVGDTIEGLYTYSGATDVLESYETPEGTSAPELAKRVTELERLVKLLVENNNGPTNYFID
jgi:hypothetical protein